MPPHKVKVVNAQGTLKGAEKWNNKKGTVKKLVKN
jgi:hypothetical protein